MKTFTDNAGKTWTVAVNVDAIRRVKAALGINLLDVVEGKLIEQLIRDPILLCDVVYVICKPEADAKNVTDEEFGRAMAGDAIEYATKAVLEEIVGFSPSPRDRATLTRVLETTYRVMDRARDMVEARLNSPELENQIEQALQNANDTFGNVLESSASTPDHSP